MSALVFAGTEAELQVRETTSGERTTQHSQGPVNRHHCRLAESPRNAARLDEAMVCLEAWYTSALQEP